MTLDAETIHLLIILSFAGGFVYWVMRGAL
jgi:hypothetical protein